MLLGPLNGSCGVVSGGQLIHQMEPQELGVVYPLQHRVIDGKWEMVLLTSPPKVYHHVLGLVEGKIACCAPGCQLHHLLSVHQLVTVGHKSNNDGVICKLNDVVAVDTSRAVECQQCEQ